MDETKLDLTKWSLDTAKVVLKFALKAYKIHVTDPKVAYDSKKNILGYIKLSKKRQLIIIAFRGTKPTSLKNWITDIDVFETKQINSDTDVLVHKGFYKAWKSIRVQVLEKLAALKKQFDFDILTTGHSLGAALATLCSFELAQKEEKSFNWNFGSPRVGNLEFVDMYKKLVPNTFRVVNNKDLIPHLPPKSKKFHHVPFEVWCKGRKYPQEYILCDSSGEDSKGSDSLLLPDSILDHSNYLLKNTTCYFQDQESLTDSLST
jgi:Lipase (class 3)